MTPPAPESPDNDKPRIGLNTLKPAPGSRKARKRVGRGHGSGHGKTSGRGHKGYNSRAGAKQRARFEGGQNPLHMRMRKLRGCGQMKSLLMAEFLLSNSLGNKFTSLVNEYFQSPSGESTLKGANYYWFFCGIMLATAVAFIFFARTFRERLFPEGAAHLPASHPGYGLRAGR